MDENMYILPEGTLLLNRKYRIEKHLSSGGFGNTYKATTKTGLLKYVAIKEFFMSDIAIRDGSNTVIIPVPSNTDFFLAQKDKFLKEAHRIAMLHNPHIVRVHDVFEENGTAYYVMDFIEGESLKQVVDRMGRPLSEDEMMQMLPQILDALKAVHSAGLLHLDIKPDNLMFGADGALKLIDFGASKQDPQVGRSRMSSQVAYTEGYAPMEQISVDTDKFGPWTDIYALGATMLHLLSNNMPPKLSDILSDPTPDKSLTIQVPSTVSRRTRDLIQRMMSVNIAQRPQSVDEISSYLGFTGKPNPETTVDKSAEMAKKQEQERRKKEEAERKQKEIERQKERQRREHERREQQRLEEQRVEISNTKSNTTNAAKRNKARILFFSLLACAALVGILILISNNGDGEVKLSCPDDNHPHAIDLGLPSGTKWACCNVGADKPDAYGGYFAWGETETKDTYSLENYKHYDGSEESCHNIGDDIAGTEYDVAHVKWGGSWVMPSETQMNELKDNCTSEWTTVNGVPGKIFNGVNGGSIFLPAAGYRCYVGLIFAGSYGDYWSSTQDPSRSNYAYNLGFGSGDVDEYDDGYYSRNLGHSVRPVSR